jgi:hypothetical protein
MTLLELAMTGPRWWADRSRFPRGPACESVPAQPGLARGRQLPRQYRFGLGTRVARRGADTARCTD